MFCIAPRRYSCCCWSRRLFLQRSRNALGRCSCCWSQPSAPRRCFFYCCSHRTLPQPSKTLFLLMLEPQDTLAILLDADAVPIVAGATEHFCNAPWGYRMLLQPWLTLCLLLHCWSHRTLPQHSKTLFLLMLEPQDTPAILPDAVSIAAVATEHSFSMLLDAVSAAGSTECCCNAPAHCFCSWGHRTL